MDVYEYPNEPAGEPLVGKTWSEADSLCAGGGKRLCTEAEWELACGGWKGGVYPYGNLYDGARCNTESVTIRLSGGDEGCRSPFGIYDMSGNVYEWTASEWSPRYREKVVKGGNWSAGSEHATCQARFGHPAATASQAIGFRCCRSLPP
jgi:formylglycine-generating enzyme required for sulfatase activity